MAWLCVAQAGFAATCGPATSPGTAPPSWQTYCWIDMSSYNNATVFGAGQPFSITLSDGSIFSFTLSATSTNAGGLVAKAPPSWSGAAVGNTAFLGIPASPILYTTVNASTVNLTMSAIKITPPPGVTGTGQFKVVIADAESTNNGESLTYTTNGGAWSLIDQVDPISGALYPTISGTGTTTFTETGVAGTVGAYIVATESPTTVTAKLVAGGLQGIMFAVQYATISNNKVISGARANAADQFTYAVKTTATGIVTASRNTTGTAVGAFTPAVATVATGVPSTVYEAMAPGSVSKLAQYTTSLTCTNGNAASSTPMPTNQPVTSYAIPTLNYGDAIACTFTNTPIPATVALQKITNTVAGGPFTFTATNLASNPGNITTASAGTAAPTSPTPITVTALNTAVTITEGTGLNFTASAASCTDANSAVTGNPATFGTLTGSVLTIPAANVVAAAQITCTITNSPNAPTIKWQKALAASGRLAAADQFVLSATGTGAPANVTTTGTGAAITSAAMSFTATAGSSYSLTEAMSATSTSLLYTYAKTVVCTNSNTVGTSIPTTNTVPVTFTPALGDAISCVVTNNGTATPNLAITKTYATSPTPVAKGQVITYTYQITNTGNITMYNVQVSDMHGSPATLVALGGSGIKAETLTTAGPLGAAASSDTTANDGIWTKLAPGATVTFTYTYTVTQADIDHG